MVMRMVIGHSNFGNVITVDWMILMMAGDINCGSDVLEMMMVIGHSGFGNITTVDWMILIMMGDIFMVLMMAMIFRKMVMMMVVGHSHFGNTITVDWMIVTMTGDTVHDINSGNDF